MFKFIKDRRNQANTKTESGILRKILETRTRRKAAEKEQVNKNQGKIILTTRKENKIVWIHFS